MSTIIIRVKLAVANKGLMILNFNFNFYLHLSCHKYRHLGNDKINFKEPPLHLNRVLQNEDVGVKLKLWITAC
jgi:hypothetical protein